MRTPTQTQAPNTLDSIMQSIGEMIEKADPEKIRIITEQMQAIIPAEGATVNLQAGSSDEERRMMLTFFISHTHQSQKPISLIDLLTQLIKKTPLERQERLHRIFGFMRDWEGEEFEWDIAKPYWSKGADAYACYLFIYKR